MLLFGGRVSDYGRTFWALRLRQFIQTPSTSDGVAEAERSSRLWCRLHLPCHPFPGCANVINCGNILYKVLMLACLSGNGQLYLIEPYPGEATKELNSDQQPKAQLKISTPSEWGVSVFEAVSEIRRYVWSKCAFSPELQPAAG
jgi:hypothetical protein